MILFDALVWLAIAKVVVLLFEDASFAARGRKSPRLQAREAREQRRAGGAAPASSAGRRVGGAIGGYFAGLAEDAAASAQASRRRRVARRRGRRAVDGVLVDLDEHDGGWYADCGLCNWSSPRFRIESRAKLAGAEHAKTHQTNTDDKEANQEQEQENEPAGPRAWQPRVIPGGAAVPNQRPAPAAEPLPAAPHGWRCNTCGRGAEGYATREAAARIGAQHTCPTPQSTGDTPTVDEPVKIRHYTHCSRCGTVSETTTMPSRCPRCGAGDDRLTAVPAPDSTPEHGSDSTTDTTKENNVNLEATGPEEIRAAFQTAIETANERAEEIAGIAAVLTEAADRYESLEMAPSTVAHIKDAADQVSAAESSLTSAVEELEAALADFNARDGHVAETVADAGNLASKDVLVG
jgi:predicted  nucleic acid-binding Zn-ribbon protein